MFSQSSCMSLKYRQKYLRIFLSVAFYRKKIRFHVALCIQRKLRFLRLQESFFGGFILEIFCCEGTKGIQRVEAKNTNGQLNFTRIYIDAEITNQLSKGKNQF